MSTRPGGGAGPLPPTARAPRPRPSRTPQRTGPAWGLGRPRGCCGYGPVPGLLGPGLGWQPPGTFQEGTRTPAGALVPFVTVSARPWPRGPCGTYSAPPEVSQVLLVKSGQPGPRQPSLLTWAWVGKAAFLTSGLTVFVGGAAAGVARFPEGQVRPEGGPGSEPREAASPLGARCPLGGQCVP